MNDVAPTSGYAEMYSTWRADPAAWWADVAEGITWERRWDTVFDPNQGQVQANVRFGSKADLQKAVDAAKAAQPEWAATNPQRRSRIMFKFRDLVERNMDDLAHLLSSEHGFRQPCRRSRSAVR